MKLIVLLVALIAALTANCRDLPEVSQSQASTDEAEYIPGGPVEPGFTDEDHYIPNETMDPDSLGETQKILNPKSSHVERQSNKEENVLSRIELRESRCKSDIVCSLLGGDCVSNEIYCTGREVKSVCNGTNCKCCIPVSLAVKMHVVETKLQSIDSKLNTLMAANSKLDNIIHSNSNITRNELQFIKENMTNSNANQNIKLDSIREHQGCPKGLFFFAPSEQCFLLITDTQRTWDAAKKICQSKGLDLPHPYDLVSLRTYMISKYGLESYVWLDAKGDDSAMKWQRNKRPISKNSPLWNTGHTASSSYCLLLNLVANEWKTSAIKLFNYSGCSSGKYWTLCEHNCQGIIFQEMYQWQMHTIWSSRNDSTSYNSTIS